MNESGSSGSQSGPIGSMIRAASSLPLAEHVHVSVSVSPSVVVVDDSGAPHEHGSHPVLNRWIVLPMADMTILQAPRSVVAPP